MYGQVIKHTDILHACSAVAGRARQRRPIARTFPSAAEHSRAIHPRIRRPGAHVVVHASGSIMFVVRMWIEHQNAALPGRNFGRPIDNRQKYRTPSLSEARDSRRPEITQTVRGASHVWRTWGNRCAGATVGRRKRRMDDEGLVEVLGAVSSPSVCCGSWWRPGPPYYFFYGTQYYLVPGLCGRTHANRLEE